MTNTLLLIAGCALLWIGGELLVHGARDLARALGMSSLVIGLTVVAFGTSAPELAATLTAAYQGAPDVAFGNVVGSNLANLGLILGLTALLWPLETHAAFLFREVPFMVLASGLLFVVVYDLALTRPEGAALFALLIVFVVYLLRRERGRAQNSPAPSSPWWLSLLRVIAGIALLTLGARALITGAVGMARGLGISERVIGLTMVAVGTSLPELASCLVAARHREGDIVLGNLVGSNIFNILCILGVTAVVHPFTIQGAGIWVDLAAMLAMSLLIWPFLASGMKIQRWEGGVLLAGYLGYLCFLFV